MISMKRILIFNILFFAIFSACLRAEIEHDDIQVEFTSLIECNIGFSNIPVEGTTIKPTSSGFTEENGVPKIEFEASSDGSVYSTGPFYFYAQVFTANPVRVYVSSHSPFKIGDYTYDKESWWQGGDYLTTTANLNYINQGEGTSNLFTGSSDTGNGLLLEEKEVNGIRTYNFGFDFAIPIEEIEKIKNIKDYDGNFPFSTFFTNEYTTTLTITLETIQ